MVAISGETDCLLHRCSRFIKINNITQSVKSAVEEVPAGIETLRPVRVAIWSELERLLLSPNRQVQVIRLMQNVKQTKKTTSKEVSIHGTIIEYFPSSACHQALESVVLYRSSGEYFCSPDSTYNTMHTIMPETPKCMGLIPLIRPSTSIQAEMC